MESTPQVANANATGIDRDPSRHWTLLLFADRVDSWTTRTRRLLKLLVPAVAFVFVARRLVGAERG